MINFLNLEYFLAVAEELNITRAAKRLYISQQSLSNHISNMEKEFGVQLFNRTMPLTLTYAGRALKLRAKQLLDLKDETYRELADIKDFTTGQLSIGISHTRGRFLLPAILPAYREKFPNIELHLVEGNSSELSSSLIHGEIDLMIDLLPFKAENVETVPICEEEILLVVPDQILNIYFPGKQEEVKKELESNPDILLLKDCPYLLIHKGNRVRTIADEIFEDAQLSPNILLETENIETVLALAAKGMGITFYPRMFVSGETSTGDGIMKKTGLNFFSLNYSRSHGVLAFGCHKGRYLSQATKEFIRIAKENI
ncbi:LysR family transcriptional regulator [Lacrimispora sp. JR3]|uniref:LysR family transcriptional regulator n=1 Tax=Lacrimispora sinapis TaxID=3111456 RepID=UPI003747F7D4